MLTAHRYISNIEMAGGKIVYVPMSPPKDGATTTSSSANWAIDFDALERAITPRTKMIVLNTPRTSSPLPPFLFSTLPQVPRLMTELRQPPRQDLLPGGAPAHRRPVRKGADPHPLRRGL